MTVTPETRGALLPHVVDNLAEASSAAIFCVHPISPDISDGWQSITFKVLAQAVNNLAWWITDSIGHGKGLEVLAYIGANDVRYAIFLLACLKSGYVAFFISPRNQAGVHSSLLQSTACSKLVFSAEREREATDINTEESNMKKWEIPSLWELLHRKGGAFPFNKTFEAVKDEPAVVIHSSGSTGTPKPVYLTNGYLSVLNNITTLATPAGRTNIMPSSMEGRGPILSMSPFFHMMGLYMFTESIFHATPFVQFPDRPMTIDLFSQVVKATRPAHAMLPPSVIEELSASPEGLKSLQSFHAVIFSGAPLSSDVGNRLASTVQLCSFLGSSEAGVIPVLVPEDKKDWAYFEWNPSYGVHLLPVARNLYELILCRPGNGERDFHGIFHVLPDQYTYHTKDLFSPHPTKPNLWQFQGRLDDVIVLSNGEKFNPILMERKIESHPLVSRAIVTGQGRFQASLLVEPIWEKLGDASEDSLIDQIWPLVQEANRLAPGYGRLFRSTIGMTSKTKPFKALPKGSISRRQVVVDYAREIEEIYARPDREFVGKLPSNASPLDLYNYLPHVVSSALNIQDIPEDFDLFSRGMDSLQVLRLVKALQGVLRSHFPGSNFEAITSQHLYSIRNMDSLTKFMYSLATGNSEGVKSPVDLDQSRSKKFAASVERFTSSLPTNLSQKTDKKIRTGSTVLVTGSTGSLGTYLLSKLIDQPKVERIFCLNRAEDALSRQHQSFKDRGLVFPPSALSKVTFFQFSLGEERLGLTQSKYTTLQTSVNTIFHCAWNVNFNRSFADFEDIELRGLSQLLSLGMECEHEAHFHFLSSISVVGRWGVKNDYDTGVPETIVEDAATVPLQGYAEAKHVGERVCAAAAARYGLPITIYRVGQLGGPTTDKGMWNKQEWLPALIITSKAIGEVPQTLGQVPINWIPVDTLTQIVLEIADSRQHYQAGKTFSLFNLVNPTVVPWESLITAIQKRFSTNVVADETWLARLDSIENITDADLANKPALKILDVYRRLFAKDTYPKFSIITNKGQHASYTMRNIRPVDADWMDLWMKQWGL
ncbi:hypothetical protein BDV32DRAFT_146354 [Aspergillus pseudonomiae]|nr:hypothetical protein BDV32DRAFT_146354 [Aspergillus pseudonomiae]